MLIDKLSFKWAFIAVAIFFLTLICYTTNYSIGDFGNYYFGSKFFITGDLGIENIYEPYRFNLAIYNLGYRNFFLSYTQVPPFTVLFYLPFCWLDFLYAKWVWNILNALLFLWLIYKIHQKWAIKTKYILLIPVIFFQPIFSNFSQGQSYLLIVFLLFEGYFAYENNKKWWAVFLWSLAILLKIFPVIILLFLLFRNDFKTLFKCVLACLCIVLMSGCITGFAIWNDYLFSILPRLSNGEINNSFTPFYQSFQVLIKNVFVPDLMHNPNALFNNEFAYNIISIVYKIVILIICIGIALNKSNKPFTVFATWIFFGILLSGYGSTYGLILLFIPFVATINLRHKTLLLLFLFFITNIPIYHFLHFDVWFQFPRLYLMLGFAFIWVWISKPIVKWYFLFFFLPTFFIKNEPIENDNYFLNQEAAMLIYDFEVKNDSMKISFFDDKGAQVKTIPIPIKANEIEPYNYYPIDATKERVLKAVLINKNTVIYLSDKNRGIGFYTLRTFQVKSIEN